MNNVLVLLALAGGGFAFYWYVLRNRQVTPEPPPSGNVTVTVVAIDYGPLAQYWMAMSDSMNVGEIVPITQPIVWSNIPADDIKDPKMFQVDMFQDADGLLSLRGLQGYPNLAFGLSALRDLVDGETIYWVGYPEGWWKDESGNWL